MIILRALVLEDCSGKEECLHEEEEYTLRPILAIELSSPWYEERREQSARRGFFLCPEAGGENGG